MSSDDNTGKLFQNQQHEQVSWLGNIKEMARQVAALTRTSTYRHSPIPTKDLTFFGNNHSLQTATQLSIPVNMPLAANDFSAFKTPPEGHTPVDVKQFDYEEETIKSLDSNNLQNKLVGLCDSDNHLNDSGVSQEAEDSEQNCKTIQGEVAKADDDAFHTPPEFQDDVVPPSDKLITSVIDLLSKTTTDNLQVTPSDPENYSEDALTQPNECGNPDMEEPLMCTEKALSEKDSLDSSPIGSRKFTQEEYDSGISTVDENDPSRDSPTSPNDASFTNRKVKDKPCTRKPSDNCSHKLDKKTGPVQSEIKHSKTYLQETEDNIGWQTRSKRTMRKRDEFERKSYNNYNTDAYGQSERNSTYDYPRSAGRDGKFKERNSKLDNATYCTQGDQISEDYNHTSRNTGSWSNRRNEENEITEQTSGSKRTSRRHRGNSPYGGKRVENKWGKNTPKDNYSEMDYGKEQELGNISTVATQPAMFSYRDALLKVSSSREINQSLMTISKGEKPVFDLNAATSYMSSVWTSVKNLHKKDPSKVFIFNDD